MSPSSRERSPVLVPYSRSGAHPLQRVDRHERDLLAVVVEPHHRASKARPQPRGREAGRVVDHDRKPRQHRARLPRRFGFEAGELAGDDARRFTFPSLATMR
jgi:hypothetical protein